MNKLFELGDRYASESTWKDFALVKFCLFAMGIIVGISVSEKKKRPVATISAITFVGTYVVLMKKVLSLIAIMIADAQSE